MSEPNPPNRLPEDWIEGLNEGDQQVASEIVQQHLELLKRRARQRLPAGVRRLADEDDIANSVFKSFFKGIQNNRFPQVETDDDLWQIFGMLIRNKVAGQIRFLTRQKRGGGLVRGESIFAGQPNDSLAGGLSQFAAGQAPADQVVQAEEEFDQMLARLPDDQLREIALLKLNTHSNREIAERLEISERSVERKLQRIRQRWEPLTGQESE
ncbi:MAG: ECF-type sigma factor [Mariniblastus sp.]|nr:ECF-type sigma factor [Mariniblastus sp.]